MLAWLLYLSVLIDRPMLAVSPQLGLIRQINGQCCRLFVGPFGDAAGKLCCGLLSYLWHAFGGFIDVLTLTCKCPFPTLTNNGGYPAITPPGSLLQRATCHGTDLPYGCVGSHMNTDYQSILL
jgi:hypothetical protein